MLDHATERSTPVIAKGLPAGPGGARARLFFFGRSGGMGNPKGEKVILVREETSPEDVDGMHKGTGDPYQQRVA